MRDKNDYFTMMAELCAYSVEAGERLVVYLTHYSPDALPAQRKAMHAIEHSADEARHRLLQKLSREFITPIERDDILRLVQILDDVTDAIDEVVTDLYVFHVRYIPPETGPLAALMLRCVKALRAAVEELRRFKKPEALQKLLVEVNTIESEADEAYTEALRLLFASPRDPMAILGIREIYDGLERCCDLCEDAADTIEYTVMANT